MEAPAAVAVHRAVLPVPPEVRKNLYPKARRELTKSP